MKIFKRFTGCVWGPYDDYLKNKQLYGRVLPAHISAEWTTPEHFAHDNYQRGHLPQLCIIASGWKARLLALFFFPPPPFEPWESGPCVWFKNGDHPADDSWRPYEDTGLLPTEPREGKIVRYFRHPQVSGNHICDKCGIIMHRHGWIDQGLNGITVCPGDVIIKSGKKFKVKKINY